MDEIKSLNQIIKINTLNKKMKIPNFKHKHNSDNIENNNISKASFIQIDKKYEKINYILNKFTTKNTSNFKSQFPLFSKNHIEQRNKFKKNKKENFIKKYFFKKISNINSESNHFNLFFRYIDNTNSCEYFLGFVNYICGCKNLKNPKKYQKINLINEKINSLLDINNLIQIMIENDIHKELFK